MENEKINEAAENAVSILEANLQRYTENFQTANSEHQYYQESPNTGWTTGFCTGMYWLAYEWKGNDKFRKAAEIQVESFYQRIRKKIDVDHHDMGFLYTPSCIAAYQLTGNRIAEEAAVLAAEQLISRFQSKGKFIQAWGTVGEEENYRMIIDCLMNLPLLYRVSQITGQDKYRKIAEQHTHTSLKYLVREDYSTYHTYLFDRRSGEPIRGITAQGYRDDSAWARGQAWGIYGTALAYRYTGEKQALELFEKITDYYLQHLPEDMIPYWDLSFEERDGEPKDSSAASIAICGIMEMCRQDGINSAKKISYLNSAEKMLENLMDFYAVKNIKQSNGLLLHGVYAKSSPYNSVKDIGVDECNLWGDYFYMEALIRKLLEWKSYW